MLTEHQLKNLDFQYSLFTQTLFKETGVEFVDFNHPYIEKNENYKYTVRTIAKERLQSKFWNKNQIGDGSILTKVISAIEIKENNLLQWDNRYGESGKQHKIFINALQNRTNLLLYEQLFYDFYTSKSNDNEIFNRFTTITTDYRLISYFFFIKYENKLPIVPRTFDEIFELLSIDFKASGNCNFDNYSEYNGIIKQIQNYLIQEKDITTTELLDAHSFLWVIGPHINLRKQKEKPEKKKLKHESSDQDSESLTTKSFENEKNLVDTENERNVQNLETAESEKENTYQTMTDDQFIDLYKKQMENGHTGEKIVYETEKNILINIGRLDLANDVEIVGNQIGLGFDILSFEPIEGDKRIEKQIEVKSVQNTNVKRFYLTRNELEKSRILSNYYVYLVDNSILDSPTITRIKKPDFFDKTKFELKPTVYEIKFNTGGKTK